MDADPIKVKTASDDMGSITGHILGNIPFKMIAWLSFIFLTISSDVFANRILSRFDGAVQNNIPTTWGTMIQLLFLILGFLLADAASKYGL